MLQLFGKHRTIMVCSVLLLAISLWAQGFKARLVGRVTDPSGAVIPGAAINVTNTETGIVTRSQASADGEYVVPELSPGNYRVAVEAPGFRSYTRTDITLNVDSTVRVDAALQVGATSEQVTVTEQAPVVNTENASLGKVVSNQEILDIPLNGRNYISLAQLSPGVTPAAAGANPNVINGARPDHVNYLLDGVSNVAKRGNDPIVTPSLDAIREFTLLTNNFSAAYGRLGAGVLSVALKSGTNKFHGSFYDYLRNDAFDARNYFSTRINKLRQNQFGATFGGPIKRDKTFFFFSYEGFRQIADDTRTSRVPSDNERNGIFATAIRNPATGKPFPNNTVTPISPIAQKLLELVPHANTAGVLNFTAMQAGENNTDNFLGKVDHQLSTNDHLAFNFVLNRANAFAPFSGSPIPGFGSSPYHLQQQGSATWTHTFSSTLINDARIAFSRHDFHELPANASSRSASTYGINGIPDHVGLPAIVVAGQFSFGDANNLPDIWTDNEYTVSDTINVVRGRHFIQVGGDYQRSQHFNHYDAFSNGQMQFGGTFTGNAFADFLVGIPVASQHQVGTNRSYLFSNYGGLYLQDDWKVRPNLTLNVGLRWDLTMPPSEKYGRWGNFIPSAGKTIVDGTPGYDASVMKTNYKAFSPRFGFAYRLPNQRTVVRGGYGIFTAADLQYTQYQLLAANQYPFAVQVVVQSPTGQLSLANPFPTVTSPGSFAAAPNGWQYDNPTPYMQQWNLTVAQDIGRNMGFEISYVGNKGTHNSVLLSLNQGRRSPTGTTFPYPQYSRVLYEALIGSSNYHGLQMSFNKRFGSGLGVRSNFTWSKSIDDGSYVAAAFIPQDSTNLAAERGLGANNRGRVWSTDFIYPLPIGRGRRLGHDWSRLTDSFLGGWQVNGSMRFMDGLPFTPMVSNVNAFLLGLPGRPDRIASGSIADQNIRHWYDPKAFVPVPLNAYRYGNSGRNILIGPGAAIVDASIFKEFALPMEGHRVQFRVEAFNLPNHPNFGQPGTLIDQPTAGVIGSASTPRQLQFAVKYMF